MRMQPKLMIAALLGTLALGAAACGGGSASAASGGTQASTAGAPVVVHVKADEFTIASDITTFKAGTTYDFEVTNTGKVAHEVMLMPPVAAGAMTMEQMDGMALGMAESEDLTPGTTVGFTVTFDQSQVGKPLELSCHVAGHYEAGMKLPITVTAS